MRVGGGAGGFRVGGGGGTMGLTTAAYLLWKLAHVSGVKPGGTYGFGGGGAGVHGGIPASALALAALAPALKASPPNGIGFGGGGGTYDCTYGSCGVVIPNPYLHTKVLEFYSLLSPSSI